MKKIALTKKKESWAKNRKTVMVGEKLPTNAATIAKYRAMLDKLVMQMKAETMREIQRLYKQDHAKAYFGEDASISSQARIVTNQLQKKFTNLFALNAKNIADKMITMADKNSVSALNNSLKKLSGGLSIKTDFKSAGLKDIIAASVVENVGLIKSIPEKYMMQLQGDVMRSITHGNGLEGITESLAKINGEVDRRVKLIADDQTRKVYNSINIERSKAVGVKQGKWIHSGGGQKPRQSHLELDGELFDLEQGAYDPDYGGYIYPAELPNCRCTYVPVIEFGGGDDE